jgi:hypothetical protein
MRKIKMMGLIMTVFGAFELKDNRKSFDFDFDFDEMEKENKDFQKRQEYKPKMTLNNKELKILSKLSGKAKKNYLKSLKNKYGV